MPQTKPQPEVVQVVEEHEGFSRFQALIILIGATSFILASVEAYHLTRFADNFPVIFSVLLFTAYVAFKDVCAVGWWVLTRKFRQPVDLKPADLVSESTPREGIKD